jgi:hypothetical protein
LRKPKRRIAHHRRRQNYGVAVSFFSRGCTRISRIFYSDFNPQNPRASAAKFS